MHKYKAKHIFPISNAVSGFKTSVNKQASVEAVVMNAPMVHLMMDSASTSLWSGHCRWVSLAGPWTWPALPGNCVCSGDGNSGMEFVSRVTKEKGNYWFPDHSLVCELPGIKLMPDC